MRRSSAEPSRNRSVKRCNGLAFSRTTAGENSKSHTTISIGGATGSALMASWGTTATSGRQVGTGETDTRAQAESVVDIRSSIKLCRNASEWIRKEEHMRSPPTLDSKKGTNDRTSEDRYSENDVLIICAHRPPGAIVGAS